MAHLAVIGNISVDHAVYPGRRETTVGGAALHLAVAATAAGLPTAPVSVIGEDLRWVTTDPRLTGLDWSAVDVARGLSAWFTLCYNLTGDLVGMRAEHGAAEGLTDHAIRRIIDGNDDAYHVCCRTPLDVARVLRVLTECHAVFSADFIASSAAAAIPAAGKFLRQARVVFTNVTEYHALACTRAIEDLPALVVSDGPRTARVYRHGHLAATADPPFVAAARLTGAGDTLAGTFLAATAAGLTDHDTLRLAVHAASAHTTSPAIPLV